MGERDAIGYFAWAGSGTMGRAREREAAGGKEVRREERNLFGVHENGSRQADSPRRSETPFLIPLSLRRCSSSLPSHWSGPVPHSPSLSSTRAAPALLVSLAVIPTTLADEEVPLPATLWRTALARVLLNTCTWASVYSRQQAERKRRGERERGRYNVPLADFPSFNGKRGNFRRL